MDRIKLRHALATATALLCALPLAAAADDEPLAERTIDAMNQLWGRHAGVEQPCQGRGGRGQLRAERRGGAQHRGAVRGGAAVPVTARFSDGTGLPDIADGDPNANPHGMAVRFHLPDGGEMDIVANSLAFFPVANRAEFLELLQAVAASGPEAKKPTPLESFLASHPAACRR